MAAETDVPFALPAVTDAFSPLMHNAEAGPSSSIAPAIDLTGISDDDSPVSVPDAGGPSVDATAGGPGGSATALGPPPPSSITLGQLAAPRYNVSPLPKASSLATQNLATVQALTAARTQSPRTIPGLPDRAFAQPGFSAPSFSFPTPTTNGYGRPFDAHAMPIATGSSMLRASVPSSIPQAGPSGDMGTSASSAIDLTAGIPSPPRTAPSATPNSGFNPRQAICIGAMFSRAIMIYPQPAAMIGAMPPPGSKERWDTIQYRGSEFIKVKLKHRKASAPPHEHEAHGGKDREIIQVLTQGGKTFIGELDPVMAGVLMGFMGRGLCRLEGFVLRVDPSGPLFEVRVNVLVFTLPSNITYIAGELMRNGLFLLDPVPPYDPVRHNEHPPYINAHGGHESAMRKHNEWQARLSGWRPVAVAQDRVKQVEVQRAQVDEVFKNMENGAELEQSDPGPWIKTDLFPHQRKALTFLLRSEQDWSSLKTARKAADKLLKKRRKKSETSDGANGDADGHADGKEGKEKDGDGLDDGVLALWEGEKDEKGRVRVWKNKVTGATQRLKKGERPHQSKGAILADDMGLGKTLSVVSLIAATRIAAQAWSRTEPEPLEDEPQLETGSKLKMSAMSTKVFGMPSDSDDEGASGKGKKRKHDATTAPSTSRFRREYIVKRARSTLLVCPMSTITNWEDQIREHWDGQVDVHGGQSGTTLKTAPRRAPKSALTPDDDELGDLDTLRVYIYHGNARCADPLFLADFDVVITSYSTLANEYTKQIGSLDADDDDTITPADTGANSSDESPMGDTSLNPRATKPGVETEIKANELNDALRRKMKGKTKKAGGAVDPSKRGLQGVEWFRVVLDEAHYIKSSSTVACRAACYLAADRRIALTGTPIQNKIEDIWALFKFLRLSPVDDKTVFSEYISTPCKTGSTLGVARLQLVMRACTLRRTKDSKTTDGNRILNLPPRVERQVWLKLREDEREVYEAARHDAADEVELLRKKKSLAGNYAHVLQKLLRLRQICDHVDLARAGAVEEDYDGTIMDYEMAVKGIETQGLTAARALSVMANLKDGDAAVCVDCNYDFGHLFPSLALATLDDAVKPEPEGKKPKGKVVKPLLTKCLHVHCPNCFRRSVYSQWPKSVKGVARPCGSCQQMLRLESDVLEVSPPDPEGAQAVNDDLPKRTKRQKWTRPPGEQPILSTKMQWLYDDLMRFSKRNPHSANYDIYSLPSGDDGIEELDADGTPAIIKSIVFSQWTTMLDRIGDMLDEAKICYCRLDGTMTREERARAMDDLRSKKKIEVMLVSTRAGGVGLNLTAASRAYLVEPYWNPSVESQAIDRIHRMGQKRPVTALKLMIEHSVEERLDKIQQKKASLAQLSLKHMSRKELLEQKAEELASLFS
ncbi:hypothetical protein Q5752_005026 [Cryptotrichosporon argae]